jgi:CheY-like chemotaxis protein
MRQEPWGRAVTLVATTGWGQDDDRRRSAEAGFDRHLVKPIDVAELRELLAVMQPTRDDPLPASP